MIYGVYANKALVHWPPSKIFGDEIKVRLLSVKVKSQVPSGKRLQNRILVKLLDIWWTIS
jgi:hypothetical protein